jgi:hypothetical protein
LILCVLSIDINKTISLLQPTKTSLFAPQTKIKAPLNEANTNTPTRRKEATYKNKQAGLKFNPACCG